ESGGDGFVQERTQGIRYIQRHHPLPFGQAPARRSCEEVGEGADRREGTQAAGEARTGPLVISTSSAMKPARHGPPAAAAGLNDESGLIRYSSAPGRPRSPRTESRRP